MVSCDNMEKRTTKVKPHERSNPKSDGKHRVKGHTRRVNSIRGSIDGSHGGLKGGSRYEVGNSIKIDESILEAMNGEEMDKADKILTLEKIGDEWVAYYSASENIIESFDDKEELIDFFKEHPKYKVEKVKNPKEPSSKYKDVEELMRDTLHLKRYEVYSVPAPLSINGKSINVKDRDTAIDLAQRLRKFEDEVVIDKKYTDETPLNNNEVEKAKEKMGVKA